MEQKYRINELAKDLNVPVSDITALVQEYFGVQKKAQASLGEDELSVILEKYSQANQVKNFNAYFASAAKKEEPKAEKKEEAKPAKKVEKSDNAEKAEKAKTNAVKEEPAEKPAKKAEQPETEVKPAEKSADKPAEKPAEKTAAAKEAKPAKTEISGDRPAKSDRPQRDGKSAPRANGTGANVRPDRPQGERKPRPEGGKFDRNDRSDRGQDRNGRFDGRNDRNDRNAKPRREEKPAQPVIDLSNIKTNAPPTKHVKGEAVQRGEQVTKHVDTRGSYVNLDKYNEKYESMSSESGRGQNDSYTRKQKINQKSQ